MHLIRFLTGDERQTKTILISFLMNWEVTNSSIRFAIFSVLMKWRLVN